MVPSYSGPPREPRGPARLAAIRCRWNATVREKNKTNFYAFLSPRSALPPFFSAPLPRFASRSNSPAPLRRPFILHREVGLLRRNIRHYLRTHGPPWKEEGYLLLASFTSPPRRSGFGGRKKDDFTLRIVHGSFWRPLSFTRVTIPLSISCRNEDSWLSVSVI